MANVRDDGSPLAFGMTPAREAESAGGMTKVPKAMVIRSIALLALFFSGFPVSRFSAAMHYGDNVDESILN